MRVIGDLWVDEPHGQYIGELQLLGPHEVGANVRNSRNARPLLMSCVKFYASDARKYASIYAMYARFYARKRTRKRRKSQTQE